MSQYFLLGNRAVKHVEALFDQILKETQDVDSGAFKAECENVPEITVVDRYKEAEATLKENEKEIIQDVMSRAGMKVLAFYKSCRYRNCHPALGRCGILFGIKALRT